jgi:UPF0755 protein
MRLHLLRLLGSIPNEGPFHFLRWALAVLLLLTGCEGVPRAKAVWVEIPVDATLRAVAESLAVHQIITSASEFESRALEGHRYRDIKPGIYALRPGTPMGQVLRVLRRGGPAVAKVTITERMTLAEVAAEIEHSVGIAAESIMIAARDSLLRDEVGARGPSVEGYLFPTTYYLALSAKPSYLLRQMVDTFEARWNPAWYPRIDSMGVTRDEIVTLASIIAGEMPDPEDIFRVASVYHNRLAKGMRLQADPTVIYALGERRRLYNNDYRVQSDYNTYNFRGLPPGPINEPSTASLEAALYPLDSEDLFFVGRKDGRHQFSRTYREHLQTIAHVRGRKKPSIVESRPNPKNGT